MKDALKEYYQKGFKIKGRMSKRNFLLAWYGNVLITLALTVLLIASTYVSEALLVVVSVVIVLFSIVMYTFIITAGIRRLHDTNRSGTYILWSLIPIIGALVLLSAYLSDGDIDDNNYGPAPEMN